MYSVLYTVFMAGLAGRPLMIFLEENKTFLMIKNSGQIGQDAYRENGQLAMGGGGQLPKEGKRDKLSGGQTGQIFAQGVRGGHV